MTEKINTTTVNENTEYKYKPVKFYVSAFVATWIFWILAIVFGENIVSGLFMLLGLIAPSVVAITMVFTSGYEPLKKDFKRKILGFYALKPVNLLIAIAGFICIVIVSILASTLFGQSLDQFAFTENFSFTGAGIGSAFLTILLASTIEEIGWRGYGEDSIAQYHSWFTESIIFGFVWALWHLPLFYIPNTYQYELRTMGIGFMLNFFISVSPLGFITTWVYVKNKRSMLASIIFHLFVNFMQERVAMTPVTKCVETGVVIIAAAIIVLMNKDMFFERRHIGNLPEEI